MRELIDRQQLIDALKETLGEIEGYEAGDRDDPEWPIIAQNYRDFIDLVEVQPKVVPQVVANITGGVLQGASSDYQVDLTSLDFDVDSFDENSEGVEVEGSNAYLGGVSTLVDPGWVNQVLALPIFNFSTGQPADEEERDGALA